MPNRDGTTRLDVVVGGDAAEYARSVVASPEPFLVPWERPELVPAPPPIGPVPTVVETVAPRRGRGRPPTVPLTDLVSNCMARLPEDLKAKLAIGMPNVLADVEDRIHVAKDQVA
ncbi:MAG TPA: hypothetical protein HA326_03210 [Thermoplasmata archaeon]|nr:hypothetical protein [Thermoplasmata archaeon]